VLTEWQFIVAPEIRTVSDEQFRVGAFTLVRSKLERLPWEVLIDQSCLRGFKKNGKLSAIWTLCKAALELK